MTIMTQSPSLSVYLPNHWLKLPDKEEVSQLPTIDEIKEKLANYEKKYEVNREDKLHPIVRTAQNADFKHDNPNVFIVTKTEQAFSLKPNISQKHFLYRGQNQFYPMCMPTVRRDNNISHLAENIKRAEFNILIDSHPLFKLLKSGVALNDNFIFSLNNPYGIAQHYGLKTAMLDLTSDFDVASFFATTEYDEVTDSFSLCSQEKGFGVLYVYHMNIPFSLLSHFDGLTTIGLQPFSRSGNQKGFLWMPPSNNPDFDLHKSPYITKVFFKHDNVQASYLFKNMNEGLKLFENDILLSKAKEIRSMKIFSKDAFERNLKENRNDNPDVILSLLEKEGITIDPYQVPITFTEEDLDEYYKWVLNGGWEEFCGQIVFPNDSKDQMKNKLISIKDRKEYRSYFYKSE